MLILKLVKYVVTLNLALVSLGVYADGAASDVGNGVKSVVNGVGRGVQDVGTGVGNAASDVGTGVSNAFSGSNDNRNKYDDSSITSQAQNQITMLSDAGQISAGSVLSVTTRDGVVIVSGTVTNKDDIDTVKNSLSSINGVKRVDMSAVRF